MRLQKGKLLRDREKEREEKKPNTRQDSNPQPNDHVRFTAVQQSLPRVLFMASSFHFLTRLRSFKLQHIWNEMTKKL